MERISHIQRPIFTLPVCYPLAFHLEARTGEHRTSPLWTVVCRTHPAQNYISQRGTDLGGDGMSRQANGAPRM